VAGLAEPVRPLADGPARGTPDPAWDEVSRSELADGGVVGELRFAATCLHRDRSARPWSFYSPTVWARGLLTTAGPMGRRARQAGMPY